MKQLTDGVGPTQYAGQSAIPTSFIQLETPKTVATILVSPTPVVMKDRTGDWSYLWWILGILIFVLVLVSTVKRNKGGE